MKYHAQTQHNRVILSWSTIPTSSCQLLSKECALSTGKPPKRLARKKHKYSNNIPISVSLGAKEEATSTIQFERWVCRGRILNQWPPEPSLHSVTELTGRTCDTSA